MDSMDAVLCHKERMTGVDTMSRIASIYVYWAFQSEKSHSTFVRSSNGTSCSSAIADGIAAYCPWHRQCAGIMMCCGGLPLPASFAALL
jgi:hypothetical protein